MGVDVHWERWSARYMHEYTEQSGRGQPIRSLRCASRQLQTANWVWSFERISQIKTRFPDQLGIHTCLCNKSAKLCVFTRHYVQYKMRTGKIGRKTLPVPLVFFITQGHVFQIVPPDCEPITLIRGIILITSLLMRYNDGEHENLAKNPPLASEMSVIPSEVQDCVDGLFKKARTVFHTFCDLSSHSRRDPCSDPLIPGMWWAVAHNRSPLLWGSIEVAHATVRWTLKYMSRHGPVAANACSAVGDGHYGRNELKRWLTQLCVMDQHVGLVTEPSANYS